MSSRLNVANIGILVQLACRHLGIEWAAYYSHGGLVQELLDRDMLSDDVSRSLTIMEYGIIMYYYIFFGWLRPTVRCLIVGRKN